MGMALWEHVITSVNNGCILTLLSFDCPLWIFFSFALWTPTYSVTSLLHPRLRIRYKQYLQIFVLYEVMIIKMWYCRDKIYKTVSHYIILNSSNLKHYNYKHSGHRHCNILHFLSLWNYQVRYQLTIFRGCTSVRTETDFGGWFCITWFDLIFYFIFSLAN